MTYTKLIKSLLILVVATYLKLKLKCKWHIAKDFAELEVSCYFEN